VSELPLETESVDIQDVARHLGDMADELRANSHLDGPDYSIPVLGLIFLNYADNRFAEAEKDLAGKASGRRTIGKIDYQAKGVLYLPEKARFSYLVELAEAVNLGKAVNDAMDAVEHENEQLKGVLPRTYQSFESTTLASLIRSINATLKEIRGDAFGKVYEYFLGRFALAEGRGAGAYFTPTSIVRLIVEIIEPFRGKILDPACGSGGMFVQSARFVAEHRRSTKDRLSIYGQEKKDDYRRICEMNLAVHGLEGDIRDANSYYDDPFNCVGQFDYVMANPPFNVDKVDKSRLHGDKRYPLGLPRADNGNYIWIEGFYSALNDTGRAGFVMANSASDAELEIREQLIEARCVDVIVSVGTNFFYTVPLPVTLWFLDKGKRGTPRAKNVLFIDARKIFHQIDRAHREWLPEQIEFLANIARMYRGEPIETTAGSADLTLASFPDSVYADVAGLCRVADVQEIGARHGWSLNPGRYVGLAAAEDDGVDFRVRLEELSEEIERLNAEALALQNRITTNVAELLA
jgi:type I restriction enzyme M protein